MTYLTGLSPETINNLNTTSTDVVETPINVGPYLNAIRSQGYNVYTATEDLVDNCIDAGATKVWIDVFTSTVQKPDGGTKKAIDIESLYYIADNGCGMNKETILQAMTIGSNSDHDSAVDLGKFGVGLKFACLALAQSFTVITKQKDSAHLTSTFSCRKVREAGKLVVTQPSRASVSEIEFFNQTTENSPSGTIVLLSQLDRFGVSDPKAFKSTLKGSNQLGRTFRFLLAGTLQIFVGNSKVEASDPVKWGSKDTTHYTDGWEKLVVDSQRGGKAEIQYRISKYTKPGAKAEGYGTRGSTKTQGVIWIRNQREIVSRIERSIFPFNANLNGLWVEIKFSGKLLDDVMQITARKDNVVPPQNILDKLGEQLRPLITTLRAKEAAKQKANSKVSSNIKDSLNNFCEDVKKIENLLDLPPIETTKVAFDTSTSPQNKSKSLTKANGKSSSVPSISGNGNITFHRSAERGFGMDLIPLNKMGVLYEASLEDVNTIQVNVNEEHAFISRYLVESSEESVKGAVMKILYAMAISELQIPEEYQVAADDYKDRFTRNLRNLTSEM